MKDTERSVIAAGYDAVFEAVPRSPTLRSLWRELVAGADFPKEYMHISFVTLAQLRRIADELALRPGDTLVNVGCGMAGPALWVTKRTGARLAGVDISPVAVAMARERAAGLGLDHAARFVAGSFDDTGLDERSVDGVMSEDALQYGPDKGAALREAARLLRPGGRFVFTAFELEPGNVAGLPVIGADPVEDYRPLLRAAGFTVETYEEVPGWPEPMTTAYSALLDAREALTKEMGEPAAQAMFLELSLTLERQIYRRRVLAAAVRRG